MVDVTDITTGAISGTGYFDKFMAAINVQIDLQFGKQRLQKADFATVYLGSLQLALQQAVAYVATVEQVTASTSRSAAENALLNQKTLTEKAQIHDDTADATTVVEGAIGQQRALQAQQALGFVRDAEQKALKIILDTWSISKSVVGSTLPAPDGALNPDIADMIVKLRTGIGITESIYAGVADAGPNQIVATGAFVQLTAVDSTDRTDGLEPDETIFPPTGYIWTQLDSNTAQTLDPIKEVETTEPIATFTQTGGAETYVFQVEVLYANSDPTTSSFDTVTIVAE